MSWLSRVARVATRTRRAPAAFAWSVLLKKHGGWVIRAWARMSIKVSYGLTIIASVMRHWVDWHARVHRGARVVAHGSRVDRWIGWKTFGAIVLTGWPGAGAVSRVGSVSCVVSLARGNRCWCGS